MARGNRNHFENLSSGDIHCNHCSKKFRGQTDFIKRLLKKHLMMTHSFTEQQCNEELNKYEETDYIVKHSRRNYQTNLSRTNSDYLLELEMKQLMN